MTADRGMFLSLEGIDGSGKSTQARLLATRLEDSGHNVVLTREPGGSPGAEQIRRLLVEGDPGRWSAETEILLFTAARRDHLERTILPALDQGRIVVTDRFADSTRVYQGAARADLHHMVDALHNLMIGRDPDLTIILDADPEQSLARGLARQSGEDRFEEMGSGFQGRLRAGFRALAETQPDRCQLVDASGSADAVHARIWPLIQRALA